MYVYVFFLFLYCSNFNRINGSLDPLDIFYKEKSRKRFHLKKYLGFWVEKRTRSRGGMGNQAALRSGTISHTSRLVLVSLCGSRCLVALLPCAQHVCCVRAKCCFQSTSQPCDPTCQMRTWCSGSWRCLGYRHFKDLGPLNCTTHTPILLLAVQQS